MKQEQPLLVGRVQRGISGVNVGKTERIASALAGGALIGYGLTRRSKAGILLGLMGAGFLYRGASGKCEAYRSLGINTALPDEGKEIARDIHVTKSFSINRPAEELYSIWRGLEDLPRFMRDLKTVTRTGAKTSHWVLTTPIGRTLEWDAELFNDVPYKVIAWRSLPNSVVTHAGSVNFTPAPGGRGTHVEVTFNYNPPAGRASAGIARLFGMEPGQLVERNLRRFKQLIEAGEVPTIEGQPSGRSSKAKPTNDRVVPQTAGDTGFGRTLEAGGGVR